MNAPVRKTTARSLVALSCLLLCLTVAACGGSGPSAQSIIDETFHSHRQIDSGQLSLNFSLQASGLASMSVPVALQLSGPFESIGSRRLPHFDLAAKLTVGGTTLHAGVLSTADRFFLQLEGASFEAPRSSVATLEQDYSQASARAVSQEPSTFSSLGVNPGGWFEHPALAGRTVIAGTPVIHLVAGLDLTRFLSDAGALSGVGGALGLAGANGASALLSPKQRTALASSLSSGHVDLYSGASDHLLRRLTVHATILTSPQTRPLLNGLQRAALTLELQLTNLNARQSISLPSKPHPISQLLSVLQELGLAAGPAASQGAPSTSSGPSAAYLQCIKSAGQQVSALQKCAAMLGH
ncbi:MAG: hypothetical protein ACRDK2_04060 [Solirubrobacteraceae bacterium]